MYGQNKQFTTSVGPVNATSRDEAKKLAGALYRSEPTWVRGPKITTSLRSEPKGNRLHPDVVYVGTRQAVRALTAKFA